MWAKGKFEPQFPFDPELDPETAYWKFHSLMGYPALPALSRRRVVLPTSKTSFGGRPVARVIGVPRAPPVPEDEKRTGLPQRDEEEVDANVAPGFQEPIQETWELPSQVMDKVQNNPEMIRQLEAILGAPLRAHGTSSNEHVTSSCGEPSCFPRHLSRANTHNKTRQ